MNTKHFPKLEPEEFAATRDALHAYARVLGDWTSTCRSKRKHWWHASLRPSLTGLSTGVIHAAISFELELNLRDNLLLGETSSGKKLQEQLRGQSPAEIAATIQEFLQAGGLDHEIPAERAAHSTDGFAAYSAEQASELARVFNSVSAAMSAFRAGIREETSPIQLWPHHFDLSMLWLPGSKVAGQDPDNEEYADQQLNFGFTLGDEGIPEPYFYVTAYPLPEALPALSLPAGTTWRTNGFNGAVLPYQELARNADPTAYLLELWAVLLAAGHEHMLTS